MSQMANSTEKKEPRSELPTSSFSNKAEIIEVNPSPKIAASKSSIACNRFPLPIARGIAINANG